MKSIIRQLIFGLSATISLSACATVAPVDQPRLVNMSWDLEPITLSATALPIQQGDIAFEWKASAQATHSVSVDGQTLPLAVGVTDRGNVYCSDTSATDRCYEDRDSDGQLDYMWTPVRGEESLSYFVGLAAPEPLPTPVTLQTLDSGKPIMNGKLGLLYDGPIRGLVGDNGEFDIMVGVFRLGWHHGIKVPRDALGSGWSNVNYLSFITGNVVDDNETIYDSLGLSIHAGAANVDGIANVTFDAESVESVNVTEKLEFDMERVPEFDDGFSPT